MNTHRVLMLVAARRHASEGTGRQIRERASLSMYDVAQTIGVGEPTVSRWERGLARPTGDAAVRWTELLDKLATAVAPTS